jgi:hypothetical protein
MAFYCVVVFTAVVIIVVVITSVVVVIFFAVVVIIVVAVVLTSLCHRYVAIKPVLWCQCCNSITMLLDFVHSKRYQSSSSSSVSSRCESIDRPSRYDMAGSLQIRNNEMNFFPFFSPPFSSFFFFFFLLFSSFPLFLSPPFFMLCGETPKKSRFEEGRKLFPLS